MIGFDIPIVGGGYRIPAFNNPFDWPALGTLASGLVRGLMLDVSVAVGPHPRSGKVDTGIRMDRVIAIEIVSNKYGSGALDGIWNIQ